MRKIKFIKENFGNIIKQNPDFSFASQHALLHYNSGAIYSFIPKNACSTFRFSLAKENSMIQNVGESDWIHANNDVFKASLKELVLAPYTFVILRCPFERLLSVYLDKIVGRTTLAWTIETKTNRNISVEQLTFFEFIKFVAKSPKLNHHWRPQSDFLIYEEYDDYFDLKNLSYAKQKLKDRIDFELIDARNLYKHGNDQIKERYDKVEEAFNINPIELLYQKHHGRLPNNKHFFNDEIIEIIRKVYKKDIALYSEHFGAEHLLF
jgi:hypothetical protein